MAASRKARAPDIFQDRRESIGRLLGERKLEALIVSLGPNLRYLSGFTGSNGALLLMPGECILITDPRYTEQAAAQVSCRVRIARGPLPDALAVEIGRLGTKRIGYEPARLTCDALDALRNHLPMRAQLQPAGGWVEQLRMVKSTEELAVIRRAVAIASKAFEQATARVKLGTPERDLAAELEYRMRKLGAEGASFDTIVAAGPRSALPHARPTEAPIARGLVVVDMGAKCDGYASDMTRMLHAGPVTPKVRRLYRAVLEAQLAAIDAVRPGIPAARVDGAARRVLRAHRLERAFIHSTGHGLGLEIHEPPRLGRRDRTLLQAGMAITIEPGVYLEGFGGIRIEDTVVVTAKGCEVLTPTSKDLRVI